MSQQSKLLIPQQAHTLHIFITSHGNNDDGDDVNNDDNTC